MVGVGGAGMSALATLLVRRGASVTGTDRSHSAILDALKDAGVRIRARDGADPLPADVDLVVASAAVPNDSPELAAARARGVEVIKYADLLGALLSEADGICVSGAHGKSTTTAWTAFALRTAGLDPTFVIGAHCEQLGGPSGVGAGRHFVAEACEFDRSFHRLRPRAAVVLNIDREHLDCYRDLDDIQEAFASFVAGLPEDGLALLNADDPRAAALAERTPARVETFGLVAEANWGVRDLRVERGAQAFSLSHEGEALGDVRPALPGRHNVYNALATAALAHYAGAPAEAIRAALETFRGARRRLELCGTAGGVTVVDDYAHHPSEVRATLAAACERYAPRRLWAVFQPHQYSRTRLLLAEFAAAFAPAHHVLIPDIYAVRDTAEDRRSVSAALLAEVIERQGVPATHVPGFEQITQRLLGEVAPGDLVVTMGAGDVWKVAHELAQRLRARASR